MVKKKLFQMCGTETSDWVQEWSRTTSLEACPSDTCLMCYLPLNMRSLFV